MKNLRFLKIGSLVKLTDFNENFLSNCINLEELELNYCFGELN